MKLSVADASFIFNIKIHYLILKIVLFTFENFFFLICLTEYFFDDIYIYISCSIFTFFMEVKQPKKRFNLYHIIH